ncbi:MAG: aldo/keto reductase [Desulforhopalus sp.]|nr:aldo/keto reductase [Desulforhopalus sp.]
MKIYSTDTIVPKRTFGDSGVKISKLCLGGGSFTGPDSQALLDEALKYGIDCWEIVSFISGNVYCEYFKKHPEIRDTIFLTGKVYSTDPAVMQEQLDKALQENGTTYIDFLAIHPVDSIKVLTDDVRKWVEKVKKEKKIRFFGFCTHKNMDICLSSAADLGWIDGVQTAYNYRLQSINSLEDALSKCHEKGIGIFAVKSMGLTVQQNEELQKLPLNEENSHTILAVHGMSFEQAKLQSIWQNTNLTSVCSLMSDSRILQSNAAAAMDERPLAAEIRKVLADYAESTGQYFCRRCGLCDAANAERIPIFNIMEMLMYSRGYGKMIQAFISKRFEQIPLEIRNKIPGADYSEAEKICPQKMPISQLMGEAYLALQMK